MGLNPKVGIVGTKKSFIMYKDALCVLDDLTDEQAGKLLKAIRSYQDGEDIELEPMVKIAFAPIKNQFARDEAKYDKILKKRSEAGKLGGKQKQANLASDSKSKQDLANLADTVNDTVNDNVNDTLRNILGLGVAVNSFDSQTCRDLLSKFDGTQLGQIYDIALELQRAQEPSGLSPYGLKKLVDTAIAKYNIGKPKSKYEGVTFDNVGMKNG